MLLPIDRIHRPASGSGDSRPAGTPRPFRVLFTSPAQFATEFDDNLSKMGLFVPTQEKRETRDVVRFVVVVPGSREEIHGCGEVIYTIDVDDARERGVRPGLGLQVVQFDMQAARRAREAIREMAAEAALAPPEQRRAVRIPAPLQVRYRTRAEFEEGLTRDISIGGVFLRTEEPYPVGTAIQLTFVRPMDDRELIVDAEVARMPVVTAENERRIGMGVRFLPMNTGRRREMERFVRYHDLRRRAERAQEIHGRMQEAGVEGVIHLFCDADRDGELVLRCGEQAGRIEFKATRIVRAELPGAGIEGERAFFRMMTWDEGDFVYRPRPIDPAGGLNRDGRPMVREGIRARVEVGQWARRIPPAIRLRPGPSFDRQRAPAAARPLLDLLQTEPTVGQAIDHLGRTDLEAYRILAHLKDCGIVSLA